MQLLVPLRVLGKVLVSLGLRELFFRFTINPVENSLILYKFTI